MLKPVDIQNKEFEKKLKGYDCDAVDDFLDIVIQDYDALCKENAALRDKIKLLNETVDHYKDAEDTIQRSLDVATQSARDIKDNANMEAEAIINRAKLDATRLARQIDDEHIKKHQEMLKIKQEVDTYRARIKTVCENLIKAVDDI
ncbi:MAG: DivIVA domain-containing protein [Clostridiales bacterium]|jgi:cell division initiation protein|nr:DivIVA domain-containing protein [Clostridiales bacterium]